MRNWFLEMFNSKLVHTLYSRLKLGLGDPSPDWWIDWCRLMLISERGMGIQSSGRPIEVLKWSWRRSCQWTSSPPTTSRSCTGLRRTTRSSTWSTTRLSTSSHGWPATAVAPPATSASTSASPWSSRLIKQMDGLLKHPDSLYIRAGCLRLCLLGWFVPCAMQCRGFTEYCRFCWSAALCLLSVDSVIENEPWCYY